MKSLISKDVVQNAVISRGIARLATHAANAFLILRNEHGFAACGGARGRFYHIVSLLPRRGRPLYDAACGKREVAMPCERFKEIAALGEVALASAHQPLTRMRSNRPTKFRHVSLTVSILFW